MTDYRAGFGTAGPGSINTISSLKAISARPMEVVVSKPLPWRWAIAPGCYFTVANAPNPFHRFMQGVFLGLVWERNPDATP